MTTTIILTSTVNVYNNIHCCYQKNPNDRIQTYLTSILQWLNYTNFNIILVENSGYNFNELDKEKQIFKNRFEFISMDENKIDNFMKSTNKGINEIFAINYVYKNSKLIHLSNFIIKITGRFFIPELEEYLKNYDLNNYDCLVQNNRNRCEMVGTHYKYFNYIFYFHPDMNVIEDLEDVWLKRTSKLNNILICKKFNITATQRGGVNEIYTNI
jgi:hypothetical protein